MIDEFETEGRVWFRQILSDAEVDDLGKACKMGDSAGLRIATSGVVGEMLNGFSKLNKALSGISFATRPVRVVAFNKTASGNWSVPWHQDRVIAVGQRHEVSGFGNWSQKAGVWHCEPTVNILEEMLFVRFHLDDQDETNGAMEIALGSHKAGVLSAGEISNTIGDYRTEICSAARGDVLVLKMLLLHRSRPSSSPAPRRTLRVDYASGTLPTPLMWA